MADQEEQAEGGEWKPSTWKRKKPADDEEDRMGAVEGEVDEEDEAAEGVEESKDGDSAARSRFARGDDEQFEAFNLKDEREEGFFDASGNYVWAKGEASDPWLEEQGGGDKVKVDERALAAHERQQRAREAAEARPDDVPGAYRALIAGLEGGETVAAALRRLGKLLAAARKAKTPPPADAKALFDRMTEAADVVLASGDTDVYSETKREFEMELRQLEPPAKRARPSPAAEQMWEYRDPQGAVHGPYSSEQFAAWRRQGYFVGDKAVPVRPVAAASAAPAAPVAEASAADELMADFDDDDDDDGAAAPAPAPAAAAEAAWRSSDEVDFA